MFVKTAMVEIQCSLSDGATLPEYATPGAAGMDLRSTLDVDIAPGERRLVPTGVRVAIPEGWEGQIRPRSGLALKHGIGLVNSPGTIDSDYRGEIGIIMINWGSDVVKICVGERIGQIVFCPVARVMMVVRQELNSTDRGEGGYGSTGLR